MLTRRLQILVDEDRYQALERTARARRVSVATVVRDAIDHDFAAPSRRREEAGRRLLAMPPVDVGELSGLLAELDAIRGGQV